MWQDISDSHEKYKAYLCSREWAEKRQGVIKRANAVEYAKIVRMKANLRSVIYELSRIVDRAYVSDDEQVLSEAESALFAISDQRAICKRPVNRILRGILF